jgi:YebC/PmpR family DNA-binding regulatory protein
MAGHSQFKNIMHRKGAQDSKRAKVFTKLIRELTVAAKSGLPDPDMNPRLRSAIASAKAANMPKGTMERAIKRGAGAGDEADFVEVRYEGYGPGGVAMIIETLTDNRNRTAAEIRSAFSKHGGNLGESGSVSFLFERIGLISFKAEASNTESMFEAAIEAGAEDIESGEAGHEIICAPDDLNAVRDALEAKFGTAAAAHLDWKPRDMVPVDEEMAGVLFKFLNILDDNEDVQRVVANFDVSEDVMERLGG